jgi:branched-chain amino acid transport system substrate-binding protein
MKKPCPHIGISMLLIAIIYFLTGCTKIMEPNEIIIGVAWPFASDNNQFNEGIDMAVKEINENGGINGQELKLYKADDNSEATKGIAIAKSFSEEKSVRAVIGHRSSYVSLPASAIYEEAGLVMLSPTSTAPELTQKNNQFIFRIIPNDDEIARKLAEYLAGQGLKRMVIYYSDDTYGKGLANSFEDHARLFGITIVDRINYYSGTDELKRLHSKWQAFGYDGIFIATSLQEGSQFIYDAGQAGINGPFAAGDALDSPELSVIGIAGAEGIIIGSVFDPGGSEQAESFVNNFIKLYGETPEMYAALGYDAVKILAAAIENTNGSDRISVVDGLRDLGEWTGVCGVHELSESGDDGGDLVVLKQLQDGEFISLEKYRK